MSVTTEKPAAATAIRLFHVDIPEEELADLRRRLAATRWPDPETVPDQSQGAQLSRLQGLVRYWGTDYDWRRAEAKLNALPQFITEIDGLDIHFIHVRSRHQDALPLIVTHGWPGSVLELLKVIEPLTDPTAHGGAAQDAFHLVMRRLLAAGLLPERAGQPVKALVHVSLADLMLLNGSSALMDEWIAGVRAQWAAARAAASESGSDGGAWLDGDGARSFTCDASVTPVVTGEVNPAALDDLIRLASFLRRRQLGARLGGPSLPLDVGVSADIPAAIRRAVILRDQHCRFPGGCDQPASGCEVHHLRHRKDGGPTSVKDCALFCFFHHQVVIHQWGWTVVLNPDGTTTAWNKDKTKIIHSHSPPVRPG